MSLRYRVIAGGLGAGWFVVLLIPKVTREWLLGDTSQNLICLMLASVLVAELCRSYIGDADTLGEHLVRAALLPYLGCLIFLTLVAALMWARALWLGGLPNLHDTLSLYGMGLIAAVLSCLVVVPYGLLCQYVMSAAARSRPA